MSLAIVDTEARVTTVDLRIPFSFGNTTLSSLPHVFLTVELDVDGERGEGVAADHLVPKWFIKNPDSTPTDDLKALRAVVLRATEHARSVDPADTVFDLWHSVYERQREWARDTAHPPLAWGFGVSLIERAAIDAFCRASDTTFSVAVRDNALGTRPGAIHEELTGLRPADCVPPEPRRQIAVRHTVGLTDPLTTADVETGHSPATNGPVADGLPHTLEAVIDTYDVSAFKIKIGGRPGTDVARIRSVVDVVEGSVEDPRYTLDANEQYSTDGLQALWEEIAADSRLSAFRDGLRFVEQPFPREVALESSVEAVLEAWDGPPVIVDESDDRLDSCKRALERGYDGTSHKNCKGVFKTLVNVCLLTHRHRETGQEYVLSAEDLTTIGPVALPQDLAVVATLGVDHAERNGHHYVRGLTPFPESIQETALEATPALYRRHDAGFPTLAINDGAIDVSDVTRAPFGVSSDLDLARFDRLADRPLTGR